jgi:hypothetical protein
LFIKILDPYTDPDSLEMLDLDPNPDPDSDLVNPHQQHCFVLYSDVSFILQPPWTAVQPLLQDDAQEWLIPVWHDISFT